MPVPSSCAQFIECITKSGVVAKPQLDTCMQSLREGPGVPESPRELANLLVRDGVLTDFQAEQLLKGRWRNFFIHNKYKLLERLGVGGMGSVYLCEHQIMRRPVAIKVLPLNQADDVATLERFHREARAVAQLKHANIVGAYDVDQAGKLHFLVMEYVDGASLQQIVKQHGPMDPLRAAHYVRQAAFGLQHAHEAGLVHRDIKPGNILLDRSGTIKLLDLGLARFFHDEADNLTQKHDSNVILGTADFLAPEQAVDSHTADIRSDIYSLGITFYFLLTGKSPFRDGTTAQKLIWHQVRSPRPIREVRPEVPEGLVDIVNQMIAKDPSHRYQVPAEVADALEPWTQSALSPPPVEEMPRLSLAAQRACQADSNAPTTRVSRASGSGFLSAVRRNAAAGGPQTPTPGSAVTGKATGAQAALGSDSGLWAPETPRPQARDTVSNPEDDKAPATAPAGPATAPPAAPSGPLTTDDPARWPILIAVAAGVVGVLAIVGSIAVLSLSSQRSPLAEATTRQTAARVEPAAGVVVENRNGTYQVRTSKYEAVVEPDGNLTSLRVGSVELLQPGIDFGPKDKPGELVSRGSYLFDEGGTAGVLRFQDVQQSSANIITARRDLGSIRHEFGPDGITWKLANTTSHPLRFYIVFTLAVTAVMSDAGEAAPAPAARNWTTTRWFAGRNKLSMQGGTRIWGPWMGSYQVWQLSLEPGDVRQATLQVGTASETELEQVAAVSKPRLTVAPRVAPVTGVTIQRENNLRHIQAPAYEATVEDDGCLTSLRIGGVELLKPGVSVSRGAYFHSQILQTLKLPTIEQPSPTVLTAQSDQASVRYDFGADRIALDLKNLSGGELNYYVVFDPAVTTVRNEQGEEASTPVTRDWKTTTWTAGSARLTIRGGSRIWGPWDKGLQVFEAHLVPEEARPLVLQVMPPEGKP
jgi:serine/threonine protein kinase